MRSSKRFKSQNVENTENKIDSNYFTVILRKNVLISGLIGLLLVGISFGQNTSAQYSDNSKDSSLKGSGRINPSTLAMEMDIPLGNYPGRGINVPITMSYSSKIWRLEYSHQQNLNDEINCNSINNPVFSEKAASGWTTSLDVPFIEYIGWENFYDINGFVKQDLPCPHPEPNQPPPPNINYMIKRIMVHLPSGESHEMRMDDTKHSYSASASPPTKSGTYYAVDSSNLKYIQTGTSGKLLIPDGSSYDFTDGKATKFTDRNGNYTSYNATTKIWTDTLGRPLSAPFEPTTPTSPTIGNNPQIYNIPGFDGGNVTYKLHWKKLDGGTQAESALTDIEDDDYDLQYIGDKHGTYPAYDYRPNALFHSSGYDKVNGGDEIFNPVVLTKIELPTGESYTFSYDVYGRIEKVIYPTGGTEDFTYNVIPGLTKTYGSDVYGQTNFGVTSRTLSETTNNSSYTWNYSATQVQPKGYKTETINPDGTKVHRYLHRNNDPGGSIKGAFGYDNGLAGMAYKIATLDKNNHPISQTLTHWEKTSYYVNSAADADWHPRVTHTENYVYDPNDASKYVWATTKFEYEDEVNLDQRDTPVLRKKTLQYAYQSSGGSGNAAPGPDPDEEPQPNPTPIPTPVPPTLLRTSVVTYLINDTTVANRQSYIDKNMVGLVTSSLVKDGSDTKVISKSEIKYDETTYSILSSGTTTHWSTPINGIYRGNPTTSRVYIATDGIDVSTPFIDTHAQFDNFGNQRKSWDANGNMTETSYVSPSGQDYKFAYPTKVTTPIPDPNPSQNFDTEAHGSQTSFITESTFDTDSGLPLTTLDANGVETRITYDAATLRPLTIKNYYQNNQIGGTVETMYNDDPNSTDGVWVKNRSQINTNDWSESISYFDGLGRSYEAKQLHSDGDILVKKLFDANGRVEKVSNPYRSGETELWTKNVYDNAGRVIEVELPDGAKIQTEYAISTSGIIGTTKQITDQAGRKRKGFSDTLGRMVRVIEDPDGQALSTDYDFDTLGNLRETTQGVQKRYFMHDSLGRLLYSKQPEEEVNPSFSATDPITNNTAWSNKYVYDDNGNITSTTNANGITVTATYDKFNRIIYRDFDDTTPDVSFFYDGTGLGAIVPDFSKGKTTKVKNSISETRYTEFDNFGRRLTHQQVTQGNTYQTEYTYDLSGAMLTEKYPSGRVMNYDYRADGELDNLTGTRAGSTAIKTYLSNISYNTLGNIDKMRLGNGTWESTLYNNRQQVSQIALGSYDGDKSLLKVDYEYGTITENNGSLRKQTISYTGLSNDIVQDYTYDSLNRLKSAEEKVSGGASTWKQTFDYDRYGNRTFNENNTDTLASGIDSKITNPSIEDSNNRMTKDQDSDSVNDYDYDESGNVTLDAESQRFIYDAENRVKSFFKGTNTSQDESFADGKYEYDGDGKRVRKRAQTSNGEVETIFVYNVRGQLVAEYSNQMPEEGKTSYLTEDHLGSPRIITDDDKDVVSRHDYMAFGDEVTNTVGNVAGRTPQQGYGNDDEIRKQYTGYERDKESGLDYAQARYYNSLHGRFTSVDPLTASADVKNPQTFNRYSYVLNSPYKFTDPLGLVAGFINNGGFRGGCSASSSYCDFAEDTGGFALPELDVTGQQQPTQQNTNDSTQSSSKVSTPTYAQIKAAADDGNAVALAVLQILGNTFKKDDVELFYNSLSTHNQAVFINTVAAIDSIDDSGKDREKIKLDNVKFVGFYNGGKKGKDSFGIKLSGIENKQLDNAGLNKPSGDLVSLLFGGLIGRRSPGNIKTASLEATIDKKGGYVAFDIDLHNSRGGIKSTFLHVFKEVIPNRINGSTTDPGAVARKLKARGVKTLVGTN